jgi:hypothetical protein
MSAVGSIQKQQSRQEERLRRRSIKKLNSMNKDSSKKEDAREAVRQASLRALQAADDAMKLKNSRASVCFLNSSSKLPQLDELQSLQSGAQSLDSHHVAIRRGSHLGMRESNEGISLLPQRVPQNTSGLDSFSEPSWPPEVTTATDTRMTSSVTDGKKSNGKKWSLFSRQKKKRTHSDFLASSIAQEAFMCGVCGRAFASEAAAEKHEWEHIEDVVTDLGWIEEIVQIAPETDFASLPPSNDLLEHGTPGTPERSTELDIRSSRISLVTPSTQPRPDVLRKSIVEVPNSGSGRSKAAAPKQVGFRSTRDKPNFGMPSLKEDPDNSSFSHEPISILKPTTRDLFRSELEDDSLLVPTGMQQYVVLADEALVDVCNKAEPMILTQSEVEAELELEWLAKDKDYYDLLTKRDAERRKDGRYRRFRAEGKSVVSKVQNKFVDAYQLMKEGQPKSGSQAIDHYTRKAKGDAEDMHVIDHSKDTLYVNVIVKNSIQVVRHELERLAKQRWEDEIKKNNEQGTGIDLRKERFQAVRARVQGNLVKLAGLALASDFTPRRIAVQLSNDLYR